MTFKMRPTELTPAERRAYAALRRDTHVDESEEERTVRALRARGVFGGQTRTASRTWWRATAIVSAAAAGIVAILQATRLNDVSPGTAVQARDTNARADSHASATETTTARIAGSAQPRQEKNSLLVWY